MGVADRIEYDFLPTLFLGRAGIIKFWWRYFNEKRQSLEAQFTQRSKSWRDQVKIKICEINLL